MARWDHIVQTGRKHGIGAATRLAGAYARQFTRGTRFHFAYPDVEWGDDVVIHGRLVIRGFGRVEIGNRCHFDNRSGEPNVISTLNRRATIRIGDDCYLNGVTLLATESIDIGKLCLFGPSLVTDSDFHSIEANRRQPGVAGRAAPVSIADNVWVGSNVMVLRGVSIGENSVVGAGTIVRGDVAHDVVVGGNPQQVLQRLGDRDDGQSRTQ